MAIRNYLCGVALIFAMCSCGPATINNETEQGMLKEFDRVTHFTYKGHKYIKFEHSFPAREAAVGIVHDPNCHCHENSN